MLACTVQYCPTLSCLCHWNCHSCCEIVPLLQILAQSWFRWGEGVGGCQLVLLVIQDWLVGVNADERLDCTLYIICSLTCNECKTVLNWVKMNTFRHVCTHAPLPHMHAYKTDSGRHIHPHRYTQTSAYMLVLSPPPLSPLHTHTTHTPASVSWHQSTMKVSKSLLQTSIPDYQKSVCLSKEVIFAPFQRVLLC